MTKKYITTTLPYINSVPHIGHCYEFVLADIITKYFRNKLGSDNVFFNVGIDEHGQKVYDKSIQEHFSVTQDYCNALAKQWKQFCVDFNIEYNNFYRTTDQKHKEGVVRYFKQIEGDVYTDSYNGYYCKGCEAYITPKEIVDGKCPIHNEELVQKEETNLFFDLKKYDDKISDILIDKSLSQELKNIISDKDFKLSITRKNVKWGIDAGNGDVFYVWADALLNYIFSVKYFEDKEYFNSYWDNSLQICGKDNLKFQAYILQALLLSGCVKQTKELLVHGLILDKDGNKISKSLGNTIDPSEQKSKYGLSALRYYLFFGLNTFSDSKYSEEYLTSLWNSDVVNGLGNIIARTLHLVDIRNINVNEYEPDDFIRAYVTNQISQINDEFERYHFNLVRLQLNAIVARLNKRFQDDRPFEDKPESPQIIKEIYYELAQIIPFYSIILTDHEEQLEKAFKENKKVIIFQRFQ